MLEVIKSFDMGNLITLIATSFVNIANWINLEMTKKMFNLLWKDYNNCFQFYTFETISNCRSHRKTIIIIRIIIITLFCDICRSAYNYFKNSSSNKPLRVIRTFINSVNSNDFRCSEIMWPNRHCSENKRIEHFSIRLFNVRKY